LQVLDELLDDEVAARERRSITVPTKLARLPMLKILSSFEATSFFMREISSDD